MNFIQVILMLRMLPMLCVLLCISWLEMAVTIGQAAAAPTQIRKTGLKKPLYKPRKRSAPKGSITTTATRGCPIEASDAGKFIALAPVLTPGQTTSTRPTFAWYVPHKKAYQLRFELAIASDDFNQIIYQIDRSSNPGIMQLTLPENQAELAIGQSYSWRVILACEDGRPSSDQLVGAEIEVVSRQPIAPTVQKYAADGLWYEAFALASPSEQKQLLIDLAASEAADPDDRALKQSESLKAVIPLLEP
jgi:Domain of Unknown Function (DUF928)